MAPRYRICCLTKNRVNPAYVGAQIGAARVARRLGCELIPGAPETPDDAGEQIALLEAAIEARPDAILIAPVDPTALNPSLLKAIDAGIPLVYFVSEAEGVAANAFVTSDNRRLAAEIARYLFRSLGGAGRVAIIEGLSRSPTSAPRTRGFLAAARDFPGIGIMASVAGNYQRADAERAMAGLLSRHGTPDGVLAANDVMAFGAIDALDAAGQRSMVVGINAVPEAITAIREGKLLATVSYDALSLACTAVEAAVEILKGRPVPELIELPAEIVDRENCAAWDLPYEQRPLPSWDAVLAHARRNGTGGRPRGG